MPASGLSLDRSRILLGGSLLVYPERCFEGGPVAPDSPPRPYGLAPTAIVGADEALLAIAAGEAVWFGLQAVDPERPARLRAELDGAQTIDLDIPPHHFLVGAPGPDGRAAPFTAGKLSLSLLEPSTAGATIRIVDLDAFAALTGEEAQPIDPDSGFGGWRLP